MAQAHAAAPLLTPAGRRSSTGKPESVEQPKRTTSLRHATTVQRPGVVNRLRVARAAGIVLLTAPPGYGKTTVVAEWSRRDGRPFAWVTVEAGEDARSFVAQLATALAHTVERARGASIARRLPPEQTIAYLGRLLAAAK